ncbi:MULTISPECIES: hypothetical protein [Oceanibaculum]|uniref:Uncharacterized protein n=2 Tax=Oceanibaculum indicum TaxID=526216 RepID=K2JEW0_9PROT|nr:MULTISPECIES: hypothetical protein [Oceanibaculum]EKE73628.1 hypothetical protein P24_13091 [Oceanibaculum indicum P24]MCH2393057.1 hypothetical protein [Oceanibaculum sp.]RKQ73897.1 hypothetical protein BCL74_1689 [Oceanibaculum indicum]
MLGWVVRIMLSLSAMLTGLFVAEDAHDFHIVNAFVAIALILLGFVLLVYWRRILDVAAGLFSRQDRP